MIDLPKFANYIEQNCKKYLSKEEKDCIVTDIQTFLSFDFEEESYTFTIKTWKKKKRRRI